MLQQKHSYIKKLNMYKKKKRKKRRKRICFDQGWRKYYCMSRRTQAK